MKYRYHLIIEDIENDEEILEIKGSSTSKNVKTCLKSVRRYIDSSIKAQVDYIEGEEQLEALKEELLSKTE